MKNPKCPACGSDAKENLETVRQDFGGLPVTLVDVPVISCGLCGERTVGIPAPAKLQRLLAETVARKSARLVPAEIRFLRKSLGLSTVDLAAIMRVDRSTVSRWESQTEPQDMGGPAEQLLRVLALTKTPVEQYPLSEMGSTDAAPIHLAIEHNKHGWQPRAA